MREKKSFEMFKWTTFAFLLALVFFILSSAMEGSRVLWIVLAILSLVVGGVLLFLTYKHTPRRTNFFLYDARRGRYLSAQELTFDVVNDRMENYLGDFVSSTIFLWQELPKKLLIELQAKEVLRPVLGYKMLYDLSIADAADAVSAFNEAEDRTVAFVCRAIRDGGNEDLADFLFRIKRNGEMDDHQLSVFFAKNRRYLENQTMRYIDEHLEDFAFTGTSN